MHVCMCVCFHPFLFNQNNPLFLLVYQTVFRKFFISFENDDYFKLIKIILRLKNVWVKACRSTQRSLKKSRFKL